MSFNSTPYKSRPPPGQQGSTPFRSSSASKFRSSLVPSSRASPARALNPSTKLTKTSTAARDLFRTSTPRSQRTTKFAPDLPAEVTRPNASVRKFAPRRSVSTGMSNTASTEPFKMRIPSPDPHLTGEVLAKEVPDDPNRTGSIYADQYLAHKCPQHFDELQRRQFFCILDLRRLKYAADEIFAKKDWKLNILNFAKEYEKSRGLIMLRYGLYEFKSVKPSADLLKKWRAAHGLPDPEDDESTTQQNLQTPGPGTKSTKRKAEDELTSKDNSLSVSTANHNKRRNVDNEDHNPLLTGPAPFKTSKRKVDEADELDENQPNKLQKSTPSAATSMFESILNGTRKGAASPSKQSQSTPLFGVPKPNTSQDAGFTPKANPFQSTSRSMVFGSANTTNTTTPSGSAFSTRKVESTPTTNTGNIFSYLSESPGSSSDEDEPEPANDSEDQLPSTAISTGTSTPPLKNGSSSFATSKTEKINIFGGVSSSMGQPAKGGLFERVQTGANGKPVRVTSEPDAKTEALPPIPPPTADGQTPAKPPGDYTFNPATTPISFGQSTSKSTATAGVGFSAKPASSLPSQSENPVSIFGLSGQTSFGTQPGAPSLFGSTDSTKPKPSEAPVSIFTSQKAVPAPSTSSIFGAAPAASTEKPSTEGIKQSDEASSTNAKKQAPSIFDSPATKASATTETKSIFDKVDNRDVSGVSAAKDKVPSIFDKSFIQKNAAQAKAKPSTPEASHNLFSRSSNPLFSGAKANGNSSGDSKSISDKVDNRDVSSVSAGKDKVPSIFDKSFIQKNAAQAKAKPSNPEASHNLFSRSSNPLFSGAKANGNSSVDSKSIFDQGAKEDAAKSASNNGTQKTASDDTKQDNASASDSAVPSSTTKSIFGTSGDSNATKSAPATSMFGTPGVPKPSASTPATSIFGMQGNSKSATPRPITFGENKPDKATKPGSGIFGNSPATPGLTSLFGEKKSDEATKPAAGLFGNSPATSAPSFSFGSQPASNNNTQSSSITFGASSAVGSPAVSFGASTSQANGSGPKKVDFQFGSSAPSTSSTPFTFGQEVSSGSSFSFTAGGDKQSINNPFAASKPNSQSSAPMFGAGSSLPTPSSSFNFSFGQEPASTPVAASSSQGGGFFGNSANTNNAASFSFTGASTSQNAPTVTGSKAAAPMSIFGHLHTSDGPTGASSPFPAPSSMGTTPVNGTPEPQVPNEDGGEAPQTQISLTDVGPGEEDEIMIHEVRAKAIKYIPVQQGDDDEGSKSPWSTRGVGPLRVLKNKATGTVRMLLRAEPRGHIALNKTILSDIEYKAKEKTVNFVAASDDGSALETWVLQVKKPEFAQELASVLEANKNANRK